MSAVGVLIFFAIVGSFICARSRSAGGAIAFAVLAMVLVIGTPIGAGIPQAVATFLDAVNGASTPTLTGTADSGGVG